MSRPISVTDDFNARSLLAERIHVLLLPPTCKRRPLGIPRETPFTARATRKAPLANKFALGIISLRQQIVPAAHTVYESVSICLRDVHPANHKSLSFVQRKAWWWLSCPAREPEAERLGRTAGPRSTRRHDDYR